MRSIEFLREAGPGDPGFIPTDAEYAAQQAQGQKNLDAIKGVGQKIAGAFKGNKQAATTVAPTPLTDTYGNTIASGTPGVNWNAQSAPVNSMDDRDDAYVTPTAPVNSMDDRDDAYATPFVTPTATAAASKLPTRPGQQTSGRQPDPAVLKIQKDLIAKGYKIKADGIMGPATQAAQKAAAGSNQSSAETSRLSRTTPGAIQQAATTAIDPTTQSVGQRLATGPSLIDRGRARLGIPAGGTSPAAAPAAPAAPPQQRQGVPMRESSFNESVSQMRRLSTMLKG